MVKFVPCVVKPSETGSGTGKYRSGSGRGKQVVTVGVEPPIPKRKERMLPIRPPVFGLSVISGVVILAKPLTWTAVEDLELAWMFVLTARPPRRLETFRAAEAFKFNANASVAARGAQRPRATARARTGVVPEPKTPLNRWLALYWIVTSM